jgi:hypothetical protein
VSRHVLRRRRPRTKRHVVALAVASTLLLDGVIAHAIFGEAVTVQQCYGRDEAGGRSC